MSRISFDMYGKLAVTSCSDTEAAGRYSNQRLAEKRIIPDVIKKMHLGVDDDLLEIGCGPGSLLIPLSFFVGSTTGIDNPMVLKRLKGRFSDPNIKLVGGNFLDIELKEKFSKILVYSVLQMLTNKEEVMIFVERAVHLLEPGGILLLGDLPNADLKARFLKTKEGQEFFRQWKAEMDGHTTIDTGLNTDNKTVEINDDLIQALTLFAGNQGLKSKLLRQPSNLPFGNTRQDLCLSRPL